VEAASLTVRAGRNGPLFLRGAVAVVDADGSHIVADDRVALCRCGLSQRKPFCDNSHRAAGWRDASPEPAPAP
jgi:CDGSH-type Zn-finger protein